MGWVRVDDAFYDHVGWADTSNAARGAWLNLVAWSNRNLSDGHIPEGVAVRMATTEELDELVENGRLHRNGNGLNIHAYLDWQPSAEQVRAKREREKSRWHSRGERKNAADEPSADTPEQHRDDSAATPRGVPPDSAATPPASQPQPQEEMADDASHRRGTKKQRDEAFDALVAVFGPASTRSRKGMYGKAVTELINADGASPAEIVRRGRFMLEKGWHDPTPMALTKHWDALAKSGEYEHWSEGL